MLSREKQERHIRLAMQSVFFFLLLGASWVKKNVTQFQSGCATLAKSNMLPLCQLAIDQLNAASTAVSGKANTGLSESGWKALAELIGSISPSSDKLIDNEFEDKESALFVWLRTGYYASSRKDGQGGSRAVTIRDVDVDDFALKRVRSFSKRDGGLLNANVALQQLKSLNRNIEAPATQPAQSRIIIVKD